MNDTMKTNCVRGLVTGHFSEPWTFQLKQSVLVKCYLLCWLTVTVACVIQEIIVEKWMAFPVCSMGIYKCPVLWYSLCLTFWNDQESCMCFHGTSVFLSAWQSKRNSDCREGTGCFVSLWFLCWVVFFNGGDSFGMKRLLRFLLDLVSLCFC